MRSGRGLLVLVVVLAGLLAYLYFVDAERPVGETEEKPTVFSVEADQIEALRVSTAGEVAELKKEGDQWQLVSPVTVGADESEVSAITSALETLEIQRVVDENPSSLSDYGLEEPAVEVSFRTAGTDEFRTLQLGSKTPTGSDMYAKLADEPRVFLVFGYLDSTFEREPFDLRDKTLLAFDRDKVDRLELTRDDAADIVLTKASAEWRLESPVEARADFSAVEGLVSRLQSAQMTSIVTEEETDLAEYGLVDPAARASVGAGSTRAELAFGGTNDEGDVYVRDVNREGVFTVAADLLTEVEKPVADFRRKDVFEARAYNTDQVALSRDGATTTIERVAGQGEDGADTWQRSGSDAEVDTVKFEAALGRLLGLRATDFADEKAAGGATEVLGVRATFDEGGRTDEVSFLRTDDTVYARRAGEPGLAVVETTGFEEALKGLEEFK